MTSVALIVTGKLEQVALAGSLGRLFPDAEFSTQKTDSFTSGRVSLPLPDRETRADELAKHMILAVDPGRTGEPADFVIAIDDLELDNADQPEVVIDYFRHAVQRQLATVFSSEPRREKTRQAVRQRCSFHLLAPMIESYFYAEPAALVRAGARRPSVVDASAIDLEAFTADDAAFVQPDDGAFYWARADRRRHPKRYLQFLCDLEGTGGPQQYRETRGGLRALRELDWAAVLAPDESVAYARALIADLADALALAPPVPLSGTCHPLTRLGAGHGVLRNV